MFQIRKNIKSIFIASFVLMTLSACEKEEPAKSSPAAAPALQKVTIINAEKSLVQPEFEVPAVIEATQTASIRPLIAATVIAEYSTPGQLVRKGDLLVELDDSQYVAMLAESKASLLEAQANATQAAANFDRAKTLKPKGHISAQEYDQIKANADIAKARIARAEAELIRAELDMKYTRILAPFSGRISSASFSVGDFVMPSSPSQPKPLFELVKLDPIYAASQIDLKLYDNFVLKRLELKKQGIEIPPLELGLKLPNGVKYSYKGVFENWDHRAAEESGSIAARVLFENPDGLLLPGHSVTLTGRVIDKLERILIPQMSVSMDQQGHYVFVIEAGVVARKNITVGIRHGSDWGIISGLETGDQVIVEGLQKVRPGDAVDSSRYKPAGQ